MKFAARVLVGLLLSAPCVANTVIDGYKSCTRTDDGRPVCISVATDKYHFVSEAFFASYFERLRAVETRSTSAPAYPSPTNPEQIFAQASRSIVTIVAVDGAGEFSGLGSGVVIGNALVVTNCHVLEQAHAAAVVFEDQGFESKLVDSQIDRDLCLLHVAGLGASPIRIDASENVRVGQKVYALGAPHGLQLTFSEGMVSSLRGSGFPQIIQTTAPISPGSSGGALLSSAGELIGITTMQYTEGQNLNFAIPVDWLWSFRTLSGR